MFWMAGIRIDLYSVDLIVHYVFYNASKLIVDSVGLLLASPPYLCRAKLSRSDLKPLSVNTTS